MDPDLRFEKTLFNVLRGLDSLIGQKIDLAIPVSPYHMFGLGDNESIGFHLIECPGRCCPVNTDMIGDPHLGDIEGNLKFVVKMSIFGEMK